MFKKVIFLTVLIIILTINPGGAEVMKYTNPVGNITDIGDPFVILVDDIYYLYATSMPSLGFKVWQSDDLVSWEEKGLALDSSNPENRWGEGDFWAPEVIEYNDQFYMTYSARDRDGHLKIAVAKADTPLGPFINIAAPLFDRDMSFIDGHIFIENDEKYLYYVKDCSENIVDGIHMSQIYVQKMSSDFKSLIGEPKKILEPSQEWEGLDSDWQWNEGPYVLKHKNKYYLTYSANVYSSSDYSVGYATSDSPMGPWIKADENPIMEKDLEKGISGPGHNSFVRTKDDNELFIVYHTHTYPDFPSGNRNVNIDRAYFKNGKLIIEGPTRREMRYPDYN
jgi:beta-xylosidase